MRLSGSYPYSAERSQDSREYRSAVKLMVGYQTGWDDIADRASVLADLQAAGFMHWSPLAKWSTLVRQIESSWQSSFPGRAGCWSSSIACVAVTPRHVQPRVSEAASTGQRDGGIQCF